MKNSFTLLLSFFALFLGSCADKAGLGFETTQLTVQEADGAVPFTVLLNRPVDSSSTEPGVEPAQSPEVTIHYSLEGTARNGQDYQLGTGTWIIPGKEKSITPTINILQDELDEWEETVIIRITSVEGASIGANSTLTISIVDDDPIPPLRMTHTGTSALTESFGDYVITYTLDSLSGRDIIIPYTVGGTASAPSDHNLPSGYVTLPEGQLSVSVILRFVLDAVVEGVETFTFQTGDVQTEGDLTASLTGTSGFSIDLHDAPTANFTTTSQSVNENVGTVSYQISIDVVSGLDTTIPITAAGTVKLADHTFTATSVTIPAGALNVSGSFSIIDDSLDENTETLILSMGTVFNGVAGADSTQTILITDNDPSPNAFLTASSQSTTEGSTVSVTAQLSVVSGRDVTLPFTVGGTATNPADHNLSSGSITIPEGQLVGSTTFNVVPESVYESNETVTLTLDASATANITSPSVQTITIVNDDPIPTISLSTAAQSVAESVGTVTLTLTASNPSAFNITTPYTVSGSASNPADHNLSNGTITMSAGATTASKTFTVVSDAIEENAETVIVTLGNPTNGQLGGTTTHVVTILNDDPTPTVNFASNQSVSEGAGSATVTVNLSNPSINTISVPFTVSGTANNPNDHNLSNGTITVTAGTTSNSVSFNIVSDSLDEVSETVIVSMGAPTNGTAGVSTTHTVTILDDDPAPSASFSSLTQTVSESGTVTVTLNIDAVSALDVTVPYTVSGTASNPADHDLSNGSFSISAGSNSASTSFAVATDALDEFDETVILTMGAPTNASVGSTSSQTITITDDDPLPIVSLSAATQSVVENVGTVTVTVSVDAVSGRDITIPFTVGGSAANPADHNLNAGNFVITAGSSTASTTFSVVDDSLYEGDETVTVSLSAPNYASLGAVAAQTITINENDPVPTVNFSSDTSVSESTSSTTITVGLSNPTIYTVTVPYTVAGTALNPNDHNLSDGTITVTAGSTSGSVTFNIVSDSLDEPDETVIATMGAPANAIAGGTASQTVTITDDDPAPNVQFSTATQTVNESGGVSVSVTLSASSGKTVSIPFTVSGTATNPADHDLSDATITVNPGSTTGSTSFTVVSDTLDEADETVVVTMGVATNANASGPTIQTITITDDDPSPTVSYSTNSQTVSESIGTVTVTANLSAVSGRDITIPHTVSGTATNPSDHALSDGSIVITAGLNSGAVTFNVVDDAIMEGSETVIVTMGAPANASQGATAVQTITINDDDRVPMVSVSTHVEPLVSRDSSHPRVIFVLSAAIDEKVTVPYQLIPIGLSRLVQFPERAFIEFFPGQTKIQTEINLSKVCVDSSSVLLQLGEPVNAEKGKVSSLRFNCHPSYAHENSAYFDVRERSVPENIQTLTLRAYLEHPSLVGTEVPFGIEGDAVLGEDFDLSSQVFKFTSGSTQAEIQLFIADNEFPEPDKTVVVRLKAEGHQKEKALEIHIRDDDRFRDSKVLLWLKADVGVEIDSSDSVTIWHSMFPKFSFEQKVPASRPTLKGKNRVYFDGLNDELVSDQFFLDPDKQLKSWVVHQKTAGRCALRYPFFSSEGVFSLGYYQEFWRRELKELFILDCTENCSDTSKQVSNYLEKAYASDWCLSTLEGPSNKLIK